MRRLGDYGNRFIDFVTETPWAMLGIFLALVGHDSTEATAVRFGSEPVTTFPVESDTLVTAVEPAGLPGAVAVTVTTQAGTATAPFTYEAPSTGPLPLSPPPPPLCAKSPSSRARS